MSWYDNYPHGGPAEYSYTSLFRNHFIKTGAEAWQNIQAARDGAFGTINKEGNAGKAIDELERMIDIAYKGEVAFLANHQIKDPGKNWGELISDLNSILSTKEAFERNIQLLSKLTNNDESVKNYQDVSVYFKDKLQHSIEESYDTLQIGPNTEISSVLPTLATKAIRKMENITDTKIGREILPGRRKGGEEYQAFESMFNIINTIDENDTFLQNLNEIFNFEQYLKDYKDYLDNPYKDDGKKKSKPTLKYRSGKSQKGTFAEVLYSFLERIKGSNGSIEYYVEQTGGLNFKPDRVISTCNISYNEAAQQVKDSDYTNKSVRAKGIKTMEQFYKNIGDTKADIVLISDKNYYISPKFSGFAAQTDVTLNALEGAMNSFHINIFNISNLINYLANIGSNMIEKQVDSSILQSLSAQIGNFLFDDMSFEVTELPQNANIVHVFNLSGVYVPLSFILEGVKNGLNATIQSTRLSEYVSVDFDASSSEPPHSWDSEGDFISFRETKMKENKISFSFMQGFASVITQAVNSRV